MKTVAPCPSEIRMARLHAARRWLDARSARSKMVQLSSTPVPHYQVSGIASLITGPELIDYAISLGWQE